MIAEACSTGAVGPADPAALGDAPRADLERLAATPEAQALVDAVVAQVAAGELAKGTRAYQRGEDKRAAFRNAVGRFLADLLVALDNPECPWVHRRDCTTDFSGGWPMPYRSWVAARDGLIAETLAERVRGFQNRGGRKFATRFMGTEALAELARLHGIENGSAEQHFRLDESPPPRRSPKWPLELSASSQWYGNKKVPGDTLDFPKNDPRVIALAEEVREINDFLMGVELEGGNHSYFSRGFNLGDKTDFTWNKGGRLYSVGRRSFQSLPEDQRLAMRINGAPVSEVDVRASYLAILSGHYGRPLPEGDPYASASLPRSVVKAWCASTLSRARFPREWTDKDPEEARGYPIAEVQRLVVAALPVLTEWDANRRLTWADLMYIESRAIVDTMLRLIREHRTASLAMHDGLIVPAHSCELACDILQAEYRRVAGITPRLKVATASDGVVLYQAA